MQPARHFAIGVALDDEPDLLWPFAVIVVQIGRAQRLSGRTSGERTESLIVISKSTKSHCVRSLNLDVRLHDVKARYRFFVRDVALSNVAHDGERHGQREE